MTEVYRCSFLSFDRSHESYEGGRGIYRTNWQIRVTAKRATSNDGKTRYVGGAVAPSSAAQADIGNDDMPF